MTECTRALIAGLTLVLCLALWRPNATAAGDPVGSILTDGLTRMFLLHLPAGGVTPRMPLVLAFHGAGGNGAGMRNLTGFDARADRLGVIVAYPDGMRRRWNDGRRTIPAPVDDVAFVAQLIDTLAGRYGVDPARVYATGISNGGLLAERLACDLAPRIAAIAPVAANMPADIVPACTPARPVSVLQINGTADPLVPYRGGAIARPLGLGPGGTVLSTPDSVAFWVRRDACPGRPEPTAVPSRAVPDGTRVTRLVYSGCAAGTEVALYTVDGGGHTWPNGRQFLPAARVGPVSRQLDASSTILDFFMRHPAR